jgi:hypothetical protein
VSSRAAKTGKGVLSLTFGFSTYCILTKLHTLLQYYRHQPFIILAVLETKFKSSELNCSWTTIHTTESFMLATALEIQSMECTPTGMVLNLGEVPKSNHSPFFLLSPLSIRVERLPPPPPSRMPLAHALQCCCRHTALHASTPSGASRGESYVHFESLSTTFIEGHDHVSRTPLS